MANDNLAYVGTPLDKLNYLKDTKQAIRNAITAKGVSISDSDTFRNYATKIGQITGGAKVTKIVNLFNLNSSGGAAIPLGNKVTDNSIVMIKFVDGVGQHLPSPLDVVIYPFSWMRDARQFVIIPNMSDLSKSASIDGASYPALKFTNWETYNNVHCEIYVIE